LEGLGGRRCVERKIKKEAEAEAKKSELEGKKSLGARRKSTTTTPLGGVRRSVRGLV
jgi:hypothetical protein